MSPTTMITPPELALRWGVDADKVLKLIHSGQLRAVNLAANPKGRPRWRISMDEVERFEERRANKPPAPKPKRRRQRQAQPAKEYF